MGFQSFSRLAQVGDILGEHKKNFTDTTANFSITAAILTITINTVIPTTTTVTTTTADLTSVNPTTAITSNVTITASVYLKMGKTATRIFGITASPDFNSLQLLLIRFFEVDITILNFMRYREVSTDYEGQTSLFRLDLVFQFYTITAVVGLARFEAERRRQLWCFSNAILLVQNNIVLLNIWLLVLPQTKGKLLKT